MKLSNGMYIEIQRSWYNKSKVESDGVTHTIDTDTQYPLYTLDMSKLYFDIDNKEQVVDMIISDLKQTIAQLEQMRKQNDKQTEEDLEL